jgi:nucleoside-triphosphatase THEP1
VKEYSPFTPGNPVPKEFFVGREKQIKEIVKYAGQVAGGKMENIFLSGNRGIGKSSLASVLRYYFQEEKNFLGLHVFLGGVDDLSELVRRVFENIYIASNKKKWFSKISGYFGNHVEKVGLFGIDVTFKPTDKALAEIVKNFPKALYNITEKIKNDKEALFIILDDINGFCKKPEFANWYKSFVDYVATHRLEMPVFMMLIGLPEIRDALSEHQPSLLRIFRVVETGALDDREVSDFFDKAFSSVDIRVEKKATQIMTMFSNGLPILMHEIGDAAFWNVTGDIVTFDIAQEGILEAADRIGKKYLDPKVYRTIRSERYRAILRKIGEDLRFGFHKSDIVKKLKEKEQKVFDNFLKRMIDLGIVIKDIEKGRGYYKFLNDLYPVYLWLESAEFKRKKH